jgi:hypothetical protein
MDDEQEFPIPLQRFVLSLRKTHEEVWSKLLKLDYAGQAHTPSEWRVILNAMKKREA